MPLRFLPPGWRRRLLPGNIPPTNPSHTVIVAPAEITRYLSIRREGFYCVTEAELQSEIIKLAEHHHLLIFHSTDSRRDTGPGFPDLVIAGRHRTLFAELKSATGNLSTEQVRWKYALIASGQYWTLWRPKDWTNGHIESVLRELLSNISFI